MHYLDPIYGPVEVAEPVLLDLLETQALRRLQGVLQHGITGLIGLRSRSTRHEHSLGAMALVRRLGAPLREQAAALLHDVSHTAFSHVSDFVYPTADGASYHEMARSAFVAASDVPAALARHGYAWEDLLDDGAHPLLEQPLPALCADRLDYFLRDGLDLGVLTPTQVRNLLAELVVHAGRVAVRSLEVARTLGYAFNAADDASWSCLAEVGLYELAAQAIKAGLACGAIAEADLWATDAAVWEKLAASDDPAVRYAVALVTPATRFTLDPAGPTFVVTPRVRAIDPDVLVDGELWPLSSLDPAFARHRETYLRRKQGPWPVRVWGDGNRPATANASGV